MLGFGFPGLRFGASNLDPEKGPFVDCYPLTRAYSGASLGEGRVWGFRGWSWSLRFGVWRFAVLWWGSRT